MADLEAVPSPAPAAHPTEPGPPWDFLDLVFTAMTVLASLLVAEFAGIIFLAMRQVFVAGHIGGPSGLTGHLTDARFLLPVQLFSDAVALTFVFLTARVKYKRSFADAIQWRPVAPGPGFYLLAGLGLSVLSLIVPALFPTDKRFPIEKLFQDPTSGWLLVAFGTCVAPFVEELFFRGMLYPVIERRWGFEAAVLGSALLFASIHAPQLAGGLPQLGAIFLVGVALGYARGRTGSLVPGFLMHTSYNAALFVAVILSTKGFREFRA